MQVLCINVLRASDRRAAMIEQFHRLGISFEIFPGTDWRDLNKKDFAQVDAKTRWWEGRRPLSDGMIACALSHRRALQYMIAKGFEKIAIIEDDVTLGPDTVHAIEIIEKMDFSADIVFLHRNKSAHRFVPLVRLSDRYQLGLIRLSDWGAQGYIITRQAACSFLEQVPRIIHQADHSFHAYWLHGLRTFTLDPPVIHHGKVFGARSLLKEAPGRRRKRDIVSVTRRIRSAITEAIQMRLAFHRRTRVRKDR
ncbi:MAG: glycosyltransferase family 25 protein [Nitrospira sp. SB0675_bin_23]|nr:glycosyltransferase family 25 protein [Nitrospira sp. SB0675_bin_23]